MIVLPTAPSVNLDPPSHTYWRAERLICNIPSFTKHKNVGQRDTGVLGFGGEDAETGRVDVIFRDTAHENELAHVVLVGHVAGIRMFKLEEAHAR